MSEAPVEVTLSSETCCQKFFYTSSWTKQREVADGMREDMRSWLDEHDPDWAYYFSSNFELTFLLKPSIATLFKLVWAGKATLIHDAPVPRPEVMRLRARYASI